MAASTRVATLVGDPSWDVELGATGRSSVLLVAVEHASASGRGRVVSAALARAADGSWGVDPGSSLGRTSPEAPGATLAVELLGRVLVELGAGVVGELRSEGLVVERERLTRAAHSARRRLDAAERVLTTRRREAEEADTALADLLGELGEESSPSR